MTDTSLDILALTRKFFEEQVPFHKFLGIRVPHLEKGFARLELPFRKELIGDAERPALHGGVLSALLDTAGGAASFTCATSPRDRLSTIDLRVDYLRPGRLETVVAEARVVRMGNRVSSVDLCCFHPDDPDHLIATGKAVYNVKRGQDPVNSPPRS